jgi:acetoin utilization protein AcuB
MTRNVAIGELMTPHPAVVRPDHPLAEAHRLMRTRRIRHLPVVEEDRVVGVVSLGDLHLIESLQDIDLSHVPVEEAMTPHPYVAPVDAGAVEVLRHMIDHRIGSTIVVDGGEVVGIFTAVDAMAALQRILSGADGAQRAEESHA